MYYFFDSKQAHIDRNMNILHMNVEIKKHIYAALESKFFNMLYLSLIEKVKYIDKFCFGYKNNEITFAKEDYIDNNNSDIKGKEINFLIHNLIKFLLIMLLT